eukprot:7703197-Pyramimonas_sp.AAC.1
MRRLRASAPAPPWAGVKGWGGGATESAVVHISSPPHSPATAGTRRSSTRSCTACRPGTRLAGAAAAHPLAGKGNGA